jgi:uncharacterized protein DUF3574
MSRRLFLRVALVVLVGHLVIAVAVPAQDRGDSARGTAAPHCEESFSRTELFFGAARPDGSMVTREEFGRFLEAEVTPRFPQGLTVLVGSGQFRGAAGLVVHETSFVLILLYPGAPEGSDPRIEAIRDAYRARFAQESVLRVDSRAARVCF